MQDCSATPEACLKVRCTITPLLGLARNEAKISLRGFVDERFFFVSSVPLSVAPLVGIAGIYCSSYQHYSRMLCLLTLLSMYLFQDKYMVYELRAMANVTLVAEDTIDKGDQPDTVNVRHPVLTHVLTLSCCSPSVPVFTPSLSPSYPPCTIPGHGDHYSPAISTSSRTSYSGIALALVILNDFVASTTIITIATLMLWRVS